MAVSQVEGFWIAGNVLGCFWPEEACRECPFFGHLQSLGCVKGIKDENCASERYRLWVGEL